MHQEITIKVHGGRPFELGELFVSCRPCTHQSGMPWAGRVLGMTRTAVRVAVERRFEPGTILMIRAWGNWKERHGLLLGRVRHVSPLSETEWDTDCQLVLELEQPELDAFLRPPERAVAV